MSELFSTQPMITGIDIMLELSRSMKPKLAKKMLLFCVRQSSTSLRRVWVTLWISTYIDEVPFTKSHQVSGAKRQLSSTEDGG